MMNYELDVIINAIGHPNSAFINTSIKGRTLHFLSIKDREYKKVRKISPYYDVDSFSTESYLNIKEREFKALSVQALLVMGSETPCSIADNIMNIFEQFSSELTKKIPQLKDPSKLPSAPDFFGIPYSSSSCPPKDNTP